MQRGGFSFSLFIATQIFTLEPRCFPCNTGSSSELRPPFAIICEFGTPLQRDENARTAGVCDRGGALVTPALSPAPFIRLKLPLVCPNCSGWVRCFSCFKSRTQRRSGGHGCLAGQNRQVENIVVVIALK